MKIPVPKRLMKGEHAIGAGMLSFLVFVSTPVFAQDSDEPEQEATELRTMTVTGTRIKQVDVEGATPLTIIDREAIENSGFATVSQVLRASAFNTFGSHTGVSGFGGGWLGAAQVDLRGLGAANTLVLLNGRRLAPMPGAGAEGQDLNQISLDMVERIEVLRDGASAIYGSDAISGVVNIITRRDMNKLQVSLQLEDPKPEGGESVRVSATGGHSWEGGNLLFAAEHFQQEFVYYRDIKRFADISPFGWATLWGFPSTAIVTSGPFETMWLTDPRCPLNQGDSELFPNSYRVNGWTGEWSYEGIIDGFCSYNPYPHMVHLPKQERNSVFLDFRADLTSQSRFISQARYSRTESEGSWAAAPVTDPWMYYPADHPYNPMRLLVGQSITSPYLGWYLGEGNDTWTFTEDDIGDVIIGFRTVPNGTRDWVEQQENASLYAGLEGENDWFGGSEWNLGLDYSLSEVREDGFGFAYTPALQESIDNGSLDLFNVQGLDDETWLANVQAAMEPVRAQTWYEGQSDTWTIDGQLGFDAFHLYSRAVPVVLGFEYYKLAYKQAQDPLSYANLIADAVGGQLVDADRDVLSIYTEGMLPLTDQLELNLAARYDHYSDFGTTVNPKVSVAWRPSDRWLLRASWGTGFRAPDMISLWEPLRRVEALATDWLYCEENNLPSCIQRPVTVIEGGNPDLQPYESTSWTTGTVWNATDNLAIELTYYDIEYTNRIAYLSAQDMFNRERDGLSHSVERNPDGTVRLITSTLFNTSGDKTSGLDFLAYYTLSTQRAGSFEFKLEWTHPLEIKKEYLEGEGFAEYLNWAGYPENRANLTLDWSLGAFQATWVTHFIDENGRGENWCWPSAQFAPCEPGDEWFVLDAYYSHDLQLAWNTGWNAQIVVGTRNLFDEDLPYHECCLWPVAPYEPGGGLKRWYMYDVMGRVVYLRYRQDF